jgi:hypothetical protein
MPIARLNRLLLAVALLSLTLAVAGAVGCGSDNEKDKEPTVDATLTVIANFTPTPTVQSDITPASPSEIRTLDLSQNSAVQELIQQSGGEVDPATIIYVDLTGDGLEEAIVPISSGGTAGTLGFVVLSYQEGKLASLLTETPTGESMQVEVVNGQLIESMPLYAAGDIQGFPSRIKKFYYAWKDGSLFVARNEVVANPNAGPKE